MQRRHIITALLLLSGALLLGQGFYMQAKAQLAQVLIAHSWQQNQHGNAGAKPWPGADIHPVAQLSVPRLHLNQYIMQDASGEALAFGAGMLPQGDLPGGSGHSLLAGHRDSHFAFLQQLRPGDEIDIENRHGQQQRYRISQTRVVDSRHSDFYFDPHAHRLTLITCYPFDALTPGGPLRYVVQAEAV